MVTFRCIEDILDVSWFGVHFVHVGRGRVHMRVDWDNIPGAHSWGLYARSLLGIC